MRVIKRGRRHIVVTTTGMLPEQIAGEAARRGIVGTPTVRPVLRFEPRARDAIPASVPQDRLK